MTITRKIAVAYTQTASIQVPIRQRALYLAPDGNTGGDGRGDGAPLPASSSDPNNFELRRSTDPGNGLYIIGKMIFTTTTILAQMTVRGLDWRHGRK